MSAPALREEQVGADAIDGAGDAVGRLLGGELDAIIVRGLFSRAEVEAAVARLGEARPTQLHPDSAIAFVGRPLQWAGADLAPYFAETARVEQALAALFPGGDFLARVHRALSRLASGAPVEVARGAAGERYVPVTVRCMPPGSGVGPHFELGQLDFPGYASLAARIDRTTLLSFYLPLVAAERGGELAAYALAPSDPDAARVNDSLSEPTLFGRHAPQFLLPGEGDLLVFDSGRHLHRVMPIEGARARWTIGGLIARSLDGHKLLSWA